MPKFYVDMWHILLWYKRLRSSSICGTLLSSEVIQHISNPSLNLNARSSVSISISRLTPDSTHDTNENGVFFNIEVICLPLSEPALVVNSFNSAYVRLTTPTLPVSSHVARNVVSSILITIGCDLKTKVWRKRKLTARYYHGVSTLVAISSPKSRLHPSSFQA